jgi:hypothetical protein
MMNRKLILLAAGFIICVSVLQGQVMKSEKLFLKTGPETGQKPAVISDPAAPRIMIVSPILDDLYKFETSDPEIPVFGTVSDDAGIDFTVMNSEFLYLSDRGQFSQRLKLSPGENPVVVGAMDVDQNYTELKFTITYRPAGLTLAEKLSQESTYYALIIGINHYSDPDLSVLENPINDAQRLYDVLTANYTFDPENIHFLKDANREEIIIALDDLSRQVTPDDNLLIYYTGHGHYDEQANIGYWLPSNARRFTTADWIGNSQLVDFLKRIESKHTLLITDACFSGSIFKTKSAFSEAPLAVEKLYGLTSRKAMTSGTLTEVPDRSPFAKYLMDRLEENGDLYYSAEQLFSSMRIAVINNSDAIPQYGEIRNVGDEGGDFIFIRRQ